LDPDWTNSLFNLALLKLDRGDYESARPLVDRLSRLLPDDPETIRLQTQLREQPDEKMKFGVASARTLESNLSPKLQALAHQLAGNPRR
jgi:hypothetical protein